MTVVTRARQAGGEDGVGVLCGFADIAFFVVAVPDEGLTTVFRGVTDRGLPTLATDHSGRMLQSAYHRAKKNSE